MLRAVLLILTIFISKISCDCIRYTFEDDFKDLFTNEKGFCAGIDFWDLGYYNNTDITGHNERSETFISPRVTLSCVSSFIFRMEAGGMVELITFIEPTQSTDQMHIFAVQHVSNGNDAVLGHKALHSNDGHGWHTLRFNLVGNGVVDGYLTTMGMAASSSFVLVDSFRYIPPNMDESLCRVYENDVLTTEASVTTTQAPVTITQLPVTVTEQPVTITVTPLTSTQLPAVNTQPPITNSEPSMTTQVPMTTPQLPMTTTQTPITNTEPSVTTQAPMTTPQLPMTTTQPPITNTEPSVTSTESPLTTTMLDTTTQLPPTTTKPKQSCVKYTFEDNFELFTNLGYCHGMGSWGIQYYNSTDLESPNERSVSYMLPKERLSCVSSFIFPMTAGGMIEVNIFMESANQFDQIAILASQYVANGEDIVVGSIKNLVMGPNFVSGWHTLMFSLSGSRSYDGYISIMGLASPKSTVIVDSFRYVPPYIDESLCQLYEHDASTTERPVPTTEITTETPVTTPESTTQPDYTCIRYTFEENFDELFTNELGYCYGMDSWVIQYYNTTDQVSPNERSVSYMSPKKRLSCVSSFIFPMTAGGMIDINIFMESASQFDQIAILASQYVANGNDVVVGSINNLAMSPNFVSGWHSLSFSLSGLALYNGYISIMGLASQRSTVIVDSFRYVPPYMDESLCQLYDDNVSTMEPPMTGTQSPVTTTNPPATSTQPTVSTTQPSITTIKSPLTTTQPPLTITEPRGTTTRPPVIPETTTPVTTTQPPVNIPDTTTEPENICVRYTFENLFTSELVPCVWGMELWDVKHYNHTKISGQKETSESFISPQETMSCVTSFIFPMMSGGLIEVSTYMESADRLDQITIVAHQYMATGNGGVTGHILSSPLNADFVAGWRSLRFTVIGPGTYDGYISFMGMASPDSIVLVDSFRYIPPYMDESLCRLYDENSTI